MIQTCHEVCDEVNTSVRFIRKFEGGTLRKFQKNAHQYEKAGLAHWSTELREEVMELEALEADFHSFKEQVRELVCCV
jgi:hypothetical protein